METSEVNGNLGDRALHPHYSTPASAKITRRIHAGSDGQSRVSDSESYPSRAFLTVFMISSLTFGSSRGHAITTSARASYVPSGDLSVVSSIAGPLHDRDQCSPHIEGKLVPFTADQCQLGIAKRCAGRCAPRRQIA